ncbi:MAG: 2-dehydropantoate 2-reductase [Actinomycetota bacterium]|nr:2-dehydropantoate 2-reductase [Actinomycetota bacterium]
MRHAVLGAGGIGGLLAAALVRAGAEVVLLMRSESLATFDGQLAVESPVLGNFVVPVAAVSSLDREIDVLWVVVKATELDGATSLAPPGVVGDAVVVPLLNGIDHVAGLRTRYRHVVAGAIRVESERVKPGHILQRSPFLRVELAASDHLAAELIAAGIPCSIRDDEVSLLWEKLAFLAPIALATTALDARLGVARADARYRRCQDEALAVAAFEGADIDGSALRALSDGAPADMRSSMQKDVAAGRLPELDAIAGPILRGGARHGIPVAATTELADAVGARLTSRAIPDPAMASSTQEPGGVRLPP